MVNFCTASLNQIGLTLVLICWTTGSTGAAISFEEEFLLLKENYIQMKENVKNLESKVTEMESKDAKMQDKMTELETKVQEQDFLLTSLLREKNERNAASNTAPPPINQSAVAINGLPSSCADLKMMGHIWNGFYSVMGSAMMESVYCDFTKLSSDPGFEKWIGNVDVKSAPVYFYVLRNSNFNLAYTPLPFDIAVTNEGDAMDLTSGIFTAPRTGIYFFSFTGLAYLPPSLSSYLGVWLVCNQVIVGTGYVSEATTSSSSQNNPLTLQSTLNLKSGDQVRVEIYVISSGSYLDDANNRNTHFTGFMLEEEIVASL